MKVLGYGNRFSRGVYRVKKELSKLKCNHSKISPSFVSIYEIRDGVVDKIQGEDGLISDNYFDQKMKDLMDDFYLMLNDYE